MLWICYGILDFLRMYIYAKPFVNLRLDFNLRRYFEQAGRKKEIT